MSSGTSTLSNTFGSLTTDTTIPYGSVITVNNNSGLYWTDYSPTSSFNTYTHPLKNLGFSSFFDIKNGELLHDNLKGLRRNKFLFNCDYKGNRIQPYEFIMELIETERKMSVKIMVSDILTICYKNLQFTKIENNIDFGDNCDFSVLKVKFKCEKVLYENHKLSQKELRADKLKKLMNINGKTRN